MVLFAVNDTFRALVFLPELLKARKSIERLYRMYREFSPEVLQTLSLAQQLEQQNRLHLEQMAAASNAFSCTANHEATIGTRANKASGGVILTANTSVVTSTTGAADSSAQQLSSAIHSNHHTNEALASRALAAGGGGGGGEHIKRSPAICAASTHIDTNNGSLSSTTAAVTYSDGRAVATAEVGAATLVNNKAKKSISFVEPATTNKAVGKINIDNFDGSDNGRLVAVAAVGATAHSQNEHHSETQAISPSRTQIINRRVSNLAVLPTYMRRKSSRLNSLIPRYQSRGRIDFSDVEFAYPNRPSALVLDGFSLSVAPGESVALVGGSGCGKSTCVSILEKFYDYHGGKVTVDGYDLRLVDPNWVRSQIGLVSQEPTLLSYTIGDNIRYGDNSRFVSMDEVVEAARTANIHDFIMSLPDRYDTELSTSAYSSSQLSGGQRQRIAIARALVRNAPILIFDEATSALDPSNEAIVQDALNKARKGRTSLTIAHRLSTIKDADKIVVLNEGKVVEIGKHDELIKRPNGHYKNLWEKHEGGVAD